MITPETTPIPKETAKILVQKPEIRNQIGCLVKKYRASNTAMYEASPTVKAGSRMCQAITQAHCRRDSRTGSSAIRHFSFSVGSPRLAIDYRCVRIRIKSHV